MIELHKFVPHFGMRDASPYCLKLLTWLKLANISHTIHEGLDPSQGPKGKLPYIVDEGHSIGDSELIIRHLKEKYGDPLSDGLSEQNRAVGHAFSVMLAERFNWASTALIRWLIPANQEIVKKAFFSKLPSQLSDELFAKAQDQIKNSIYAQGLGRHNEDEIFSLAIGDVDAIEAQLGDKPYFLDDTPREADASVYAFLSAAACKEFKSPIRDRIESSKRLMSYLDRVEKAAFGVEQ